MSKLKAVFLIGSFAVMVSGPASASVSVSFVEPEHYTDLKRHDFSYNARQRQVILDRLQAHLESLGAKHLAPNQSLSIEVLNIDLAGRYEPFLLDHQDGRLVDRVTWPSMTMRYVLTEDGSEVINAEERVADLSYLEQTTGRYSSDSLRYEKRMLDEWFVKRFVQKRPPRN
jgi:hypothetical protein